MITQPLAERIRPQNLNNFYGIETLYKKYPFLKAMATEHLYRSAIFYGPSGSGKTTFARLLIQHANTKSFELNAVSTNKADLQAVIQSAQIKPVILLLDEIHRLNKDKQEILLPFIENGSIVLFGLTTVHPFSSLPASIRSRVLIFHFESIEHETITAILKHAIIQDELLQGYQRIISDDVYEAIAMAASGDIRFALNTLEEMVISSTVRKIDLNVFQTMFQTTHLATDTIANHYDLLSALQKSIRGSDADAALYWLTRLAENQDIGEITRRLQVIAFEDIAYGNPQALSRTVEACLAAENLGFPEAIYPLAYITTELAMSPKSRTITDAIFKAKKTLTDYGHLPIPEVLKMRTINRKETYPYGNKKAWDHLTYLPNELKHHRFFDFSAEHRSGKFEKQMELYYKKKK